MPTTKRKREDLRRVANAKGQTKLSFAKKPCVEESRSSGPEPNHEIDTLCGEGEVVQEEKDKDAVEEIDKSPERTEFLSDAVDCEEDTLSTTSLHENVEHEQRIYDLADILMERKSISSLNDEEKYGYLTKHYYPQSADKMLKQEVTKKGKKWSVTYQLSWLKQRPWHVYSLEMQGGLCKACILFDDTPRGGKNMRGNFVSKAFQNIVKSEKIMQHEQTLYHQSAMEKMQIFIQNYENPTKRVDQDKSASSNYERNVHIMTKIIEAALVCARQGISLRGHRDHGKLTEEDEGASMNPNRGNFLAILQLLANSDEILKKHLEEGSKNAKMTTWKIQNDIISCIAQFIRRKIAELIGDRYYAIIADEVTDRHANKEILLVCLRYLNLTTEVPKIEETFFESVQFKGRATGENMGKQIVEILTSNNINLGNCRAQAYDGASAMSSEVRGPSAKIKEHQPKAEYTHCRSHVINLAVVQACKNRIMRKMMDTLTSTSDFYHNSPKRKQYFELFVKHHSESLNLTDVKRDKIIGLAKTRWVERHKAYESYYIFYQANVGVLESISEPHLYQEFYDKLEETFGERWSWDSESKIKAAGLLAQARDFGHIMAFTVALNGLEPIKPLVSKLQRRNLDIFKGYHMIDNIIDRLKEMRAEVDDEFSDWYQQAVGIASSVGVHPKKPRTAVCWSVNRDNVEGRSTEEYYKRALGIPFLDDIVNQMEERLKDRKHAELFNLLPSVMFLPSFQLDLTATALRETFPNELVDDGIHLKAELKRWMSMWKNEMNRRNETYENHLKETQKQTQKESTKVDRRRKNPTKEKVRFDGRAGYQIPKPPDGFLDVLQFADEDCFPNIRNLLFIGCISPIGSCEAERSASGIRRLNTMSSGRESNLNLIQMQQVTMIDVDEVLNMFIDRNPRRLFQKSVLFE